MKLFPYLMYRFFVLLLVLSMVAGLLVYANFPQVPRLMMLENTRFLQLERNVFISPHVKESQKPVFLNDLRMARKRNLHFWGELKSYPVMVFCSNEQEFHLYGKKHDVPAMTQFTPVGSYIILKPEGCNINVLSHELCHAELMSRLGWYKRIAYPPGLMKGWRCCWIIVILIHQDTAPATTRNNGNIT